MEVVRCSNCGEENPGRARFGLACGSPIQGAAAAAPGREVRKTLTVLFADMVGFTSLGESLDQESLRRVMDSFYADMRGAIEAQDGTLGENRGGPYEITVYDVNAVDEEGRFLSGELFAQERCAAALGRLEELAQRTEAAGS